MSEHSLARIIHTGPSIGEVDESFLFREREYSDDNFVVTPTGSISMLTQSLRQDASATRQRASTGLDLNDDDDVRDQQSLWNYDCRQVPGNEHEEPNGVQKSGASIANLTDKGLSTRLGGYHGELTTLNLTNATSLQGLFLDSLPTTVKHLDLTGCRSIKNEYFTSFISKFFSLESLFLVGCEDLKDEALEAVVASCPRLEGIAVPPDTTDVGLATLARSESIKRVGIRLCHHVTLDGIRFLLRSKPDLERVVVSKCLRVSSGQAREGAGEHGEHGEAPETPGSPVQLPMSALRRQSVNLEILKEFVSSR